MNNSQQFNSFLQMEVRNLIKNSVASGIYSEVKDWNKAYSDEFHDHGVDILMELYGIEKNKGREIMSMFNTPSVQDAKPISNTPIQKVLTDAYLSGIKAVHDINFYSSVNYADLEELPSCPNSFDNGSEFGTCPGCCGNI